MYAFSALWGIVRPDKPNPGSKNNHLELPQAQTAREAKTINLILQQLLPRPKQ
jgi:hypothetical protein